MNFDLPITCVTWNAHRAVGRDGRADPGRIMATVAREIVPVGPRVLALQEADGDCHPHEALLDVTRLEEITGLKSVHGDADMRWGRRSGGFLGNLLLIDPCFTVTDRRIVELPGHCPRAAVMVEIEAAGEKLRLLSCHLSLSQVLRMVQMRLVGQVLARRADMQTILLGDLNEWRPWGGLALSPRISGLDLEGPARATFPARRPLLPLDRILSDRRRVVRNARAVDTPLARQSSDHLPLVADVHLRRNRAA